MTEERLKRFFNFLVYLLLFYPSSNKGPEHWIPGFAYVGQVSPQIGTKGSKEFMPLIPLERSQKRFWIRTELQDEINIEEILVPLRFTGAHDKSNARSQRRIFENRVVSSSCAFL